MRGIPTPIPAPFNGINTREGVAALQPNEARDMENWEPFGNALKPRPGYILHSTGPVVAGINVKTLAPFNGLTATQLIGVSNAKMWNYTAATAVEIGTFNFTNSRFQTEGYVNRLFGVNGTDVPWVYDGTTAGATGFTGSGLTLTNLVNIRKVRTRLWFCENSTADAWYAGIGSITGTLTKFQLSQVVSGGTLMAIGAHSQDAGAGSDDFTVFVMSTGEVVVYSGDPASTFAKVGNYFMPPPVGRDCLVQVGGQLNIITRMGLMPLQAALDGVAFDILALGNYGKVADSIRQDVAQYGAIAGWRALTFDGRVLVNVPTVDTLQGGVSRQWVFYTLGGRWGKWTGIGAASMCEFNNGLYFGSFGANTVYQITGSSDAGSNIALKARTAFVAFPRGEDLKATALKFDMSIKGGLTGSFGIDVDYTSGTVLTSSATVAESTVTTTWGSDWGSPWSSSTQKRQSWFGTYGEGRSLALNFEASTNATELDWFGTVLLIQPLRGL